MHLARTASLLLFSANALLSFAATVPKGVRGDVLTCETGSGCTNETIDGRVYKVMKTAQMVVRVSISTEGEYTRADVSIVNNSPVQLDVLPADFRVDVLTPRPRKLVYVEPASVRLPAPSAAAEARRSDKRRSTVPEFALIPPKPQPDLAASGVRPEGVIEGKVFFERDRRARVLNVVLPISGAVFEFPYQMQ